MRQFERVSYAPEDVKLPTRADSRSAGYDFYSVEDFVVPPHDSYKTKTYIKAQMGANEVLIMQVRSSIGIKKGLQLLNGNGIIDSSFYNSSESEGNIMVGLYNRTDKPVEIKKGERIVQGIFMNYLITDDDKPLSDIRTGGVGSSGK